MNWEDQPKVFAYDELAFFYIGEGYSMEIEKVKLSEKGDWKYRIIFGNLFGSDNQVFDSLETGIAVAHRSGQRL